MVGWRKLIHKFRLLVNVGVSTCSVLCAAGLTHALAIECGGGCTAAMAVARELVSPIVQSVGGRK